MLDFEGLPLEDLVDTANTEFETMGIAVGAATSIEVPYLNSLCTEGGTNAVSTTVTVTGTNSCSAEATYNWDITDKCLPKGAECPSFFLGGGDNCCSGECNPGTGKCKQDPPGQAAVFCFSGESTVEGEHGTTIAMKDLRIGDRIKNANGALEHLYGFAHYSPDKKADFLQIKLNSNVLEVSATHLVFRQDGAAVPASLVSVGDKLQLSDGLVAEVENIRPVTKSGVFAPLTQSGTIAVNNVAVSSFVSLQEDLEVLKIGDLVTPFSWQWLCQTSQAPHRIMCALNFDYCSSETYTEEGISRWVDGQYRFARWFLEQCGFVMSIITAVGLVALLVASAAEILLTNAGYSPALLVIGIMTWSLRRRLSEKQAA